jgi:uncharacterized repeat protein (TIGR02543 family)
MTRQLRVFCALIGVLAPLGAAGPVGASSGPLPQGHTLSVIEAGTGSGTVSSSDGTIDCPPTCSYFYMTTAPVTITASAAAGSTFSGWSGACTGTAATCTVPMNRDQTVTATFTKTSSGPPPPAKPRCTVHGPSRRVLLRAPKAQHRKVGRLSLSFSCDQKVSATLTVRVVEYTTHHKATFSLTRHYALAAGHTRAVQFTLWSRALTGLKHHQHETITVTLSARNANGTAKRGVTGSLIGVG